MTHTEEVRLVFFEALRAAPARRNEFIALTCADDPALAEEVELLLAREADVIRLLDGLFDRPGTPDSTPVDASGRSRLVGPFLIERQLDTVGGGLAYEGHYAAAGGGPRVLIKAVDNQAGSGLARERLILERNFLQRGVHRGVPRILDTGTTSNGQIYLATELPAGEPILEFCRKLQLAVDHRVELFRWVVAAVASAQREGVSQWELTPEMIRVSPDGQPWVMGLNLAGSWPRRAPSTRRENGELRPPAAVPVPHTHRSDTVSDNLFDLGCLYHQLITDELPRWAPRSPIPGIPRAAELALVEPSRLHPDRKGELRGELDHIAVRLLAPQEKRRYLTAQSLLRDLDRYLGHRDDSVGFGPDRGRVAAFLQANRWGVTGAALGALLAGSSWLWSVRQSREAETQSAATRQISQELLRSIQDAAGRPAAPGETGELRFVRLALDYLESASTRPDLGPELRGELAQALVDLRATESAMKPVAPPPVVVEVVRPDSVSQAVPAPVLTQPKAPADGQAVRATRAPRGGARTIRGTGRHEGINFESRDWGPALENWVKKSNQ